MQAPLQPRGIMDSFVKTCQRWGLSRKEQLILLGYGGDSASLGLQLLRGRLLSPPQDVKDRTGYVLGISLVKAEIDRARRNVRPRLAAQRYRRRSHDVPCARLWSFWWANRAGARYYDHDLRVLSRGIFQQT
jgi:hypothetical protein